MQQHASTYTHSPTLGVKGQTFLKVVMLHIKLMGMEHRAPFKHIFRPYTHPGPLGVGSKGQNIFLLNVAYQIKGNGTL